MCIVSIVNIALTAVLADDASFQITMVDEKFSSLKYPPIEPKSGGGGGGRRLDAVLVSPQPKKRQKITQEELSMMN
jgi:hypothetical protein